MKISVIMPVFNMENSMIESIESWLEQSISDKELICVDDCSTDESLQIINQYASKYENIKVYSTAENKGAGNARNIGIEVASGEYISFLDGDDKYLTNNALEILYCNASKDKCDVAGGLVKNNYPDRVENYPRFRNLFINASREYKDIQYKDIQDDYYFQGFIYKTSLLRDNKILFPPYRRNQDPPFLVKALFCAETIRAVNIEFYSHKSSYKIVNYDLEKITDLISGFLDNVKFADQNGLDVLLSNTIERVNYEYFDQLHFGIRFQNPGFMKILFTMQEIALKHGYRIDVLDYLFFAEKASDEYKAFMYLRRMRTEYRNKRLVLYGAGNIGRSIKSILFGIDGCELTLWVDRYKSGEIIDGIKIYAPDDIGHMEQCDAILVGIKDSKLSEEISNTVRKYCSPNTEIIELSDVLRREQI